MEVEVSMQGVRVLRKRAAMMSANAVCVVDTTRQ
jgi:hypothetical protein